MEIEKKYQKLSDKVIILKKLAHRIVPSEKNYKNWVYFLHNDAFKTICLPFTFFDMMSNFFTSFFVCLKSPNSTIKPTFTFNNVGVVNGKSVNKTPRIMFTESRWTIMVSFIFIFSLKELEFCDRTQMFAIFHKLTPVNFGILCPNCGPPPYRVEKVLSTKLFLGFWKIEYIPRRTVYTKCRYDPFWPHSDLSKKFKKYFFGSKNRNFRQNIGKFGGK